MVLDNVFSPATCPCREAPHERFDLKGSWLDRHARPHEKTRKDSDWAASRSLHVSHETARSLLRQAGRSAGLCV